ncbi:MAG: amino acid decarboxylase [Ruminococcaceae bacterium]|nr:amino acid decarboxylase [Oscillospiraceae bacterium]
MNTPICDFVKAYQQKAPLRMHMPGHKGRGESGMEALDITEVQGADSLYAPEGIILESEENASRLFGCKTYYSTEGSSQCIRAMLMLLSLYARATSRHTHILAAKNAHKTLLGAAALLDITVDWLPSTDADSYLNAEISPTRLDAYLRAQETKPTALYVTSPDYLGNLCDIEGIARVCHRHAILLLVDNAHGAYFKFLPTSQHPIDLGADLVCDSAHKTLPVLTGGAYLHLSPTLPSFFEEHAREALSLFGSTSPSYLILQSLDAANPVLEKEFSMSLEDFLPRAAWLWHKLRKAGYALLSDEPLKLTLKAKHYGYRGDELAELLRREGIECEFADPDFTVLMLSPFLSLEELERLERTLCDIPKRPAITECPPQLLPARRVLSLHEAFFSPSEEISVGEAAGRICASPCVSCPPAVPIVLSGEEINESAVSAFSYYGIKTCRVIKK